jgi:hypothetical protein
MVAAEALNTCVGDRVTGVGHDMHGQSEVREGPVGDMLRDFGRVNLDIGDNIINGANTVRLSTFIRSGVGKTRTTDGHQHLCFGCR